MTYLLHRPLMKLANIANGTADVHMLTKDPAMPGYVNREVLGSVYRLDTGQWVPVTRTRPVSRRRRSSWLWPTSTNSSASPRAAASRAQASSTS